MANKPRDFDMSKQPAVERLLVTGVAESCCMMEQMERPGSIRFTRGELTSIIACVRTFIECTGGGEPELVAAFAKLYQEFKRRLREHDWDD